MRTTRTRRVASFLAASLFCAAAGSLTGCASTGAGGAPGGMGAVYEDYQAGRYSIAYRGAVAEADRKSGKDRERAALIAGLSAQALNQPADAERWLRPLASSIDPEIAGRAEAAMGLLAMQQGRHEEAASRLTAASSKLRGDEAARASLFAGQCYESLGRTSRAQTQYSIALGLAESKALRDQIASEQSGASNRVYTIQVGAFSSLPNAERLAQSVASRAEAGKLGAPSIVRRAGVDGRPLYLVQVGRFATSKEAAAARANLGQPSIVAPSFASASDAAN